MLKTLDTTELEIGMFVHKMHGNWFDHPFWKSNFVIEDEERLRLLRSSKVPSVIIDTSKGKASTPPSRPEQPPSAESASAARDRINAISKRSKREAAVLRPTTVDEEVFAAQIIAHKAKKNLSNVFTAARLGRAVNVKLVAPVVSDIFASVKRNPQAFGSLMRCKLKNELMFRHALSVSALMVSLARKMNLREQEVYDCGLVGLLLDIGVNHLPQNLDPPDGDYRNLDPRIWQQHVLLGYRSLANEGNLPAHVLDGVLQHHERLDGGGFPNGTSGPEISQMARMAAICDTFDFMLAKTGADTALDPAEAVRRMKEVSGAFDQEILRSFIESIGLYPVGSFVRLRSGKLAMVIDEDHKDHTAPVVSVFYSLADREQIKLQRITLANSDNQDAIVEIADLAGLDLPDTAYLREMIFLKTYKNAG